MTRFEVGDIVLVRYPFTDLTSTKKRPAVVLSPPDYSNRFGDVVVMPLSSRSELESQFALAHWQASGLRKPTWVKPIIGTLSQQLIEKRLGQLAPADANCVRAALQIALDQRWLE